MDKMPGEEDFKGLEEEIDDAVDRLFVENKRGGAKTFSTQSPLLEPSLSPPTPQPSMKSPAREPSVKPPDLEPFMQPSTLKPSMEIYYLRALHEASRLRTFNENFSFGALA